MMITADLTTVHAHSTEREVHASSWCLLYVPVERSVIYAMPIYRSNDRRLLKPDRIWASASSLPLADVAATTLNLDSSESSLQDRPPVAGQGLRINNFTIS